MADLPINYLQLFLHIQTSLMVIEGGLIIKANQAAANLFYIETPEELEGKPAHFFMAPIQQDGLSADDKWYTLQKEVLSSGKTQTECKVTQKKDTVKWFECILTKFDNERVIPLLLLQLRDLTPEYNNKKELKQTEYSKNMYRSLVEHSPDVMMKFDNDYTYEFISSNCEKFSNLPPDTYLNHRVDDENISKDIFTEHITELLRQTLSKLYKTGEPQRVEFRFPTGYWMDWYVVPEKDENGKVTHAIGVSRDISPLKELEHKLRNANRNYLSLAEAYPDIMIKFDNEKRIEYCTKNVEDSFQMDSDSFIGKTNLEIDFPPKVAADFEEALASVYDEGHTQRREFATPDGKIFDWLFVPANNKKPKYTSVFAFARDVTDYKKTEEKLRLSNEKMEFALDIADMAFWEADRHTHTFKLNDRLAKIYGIPYRDEQKILLRSDDIIKHYVIAEDRPKLLRQMKENELSQHKKKITLEFRIKKEGEIRNIFLTSRLIEHEDSLINYGTVQDITELKKKENELIKYRTQLEELITSRTEELQKTQLNLNVAMDMARLGIWEYDLDSHNFFIGKRIADIYDVPPPPPGKKRYVVGLEKLIERIHPEDLNNWQKYAKSVREAKAGDLIDDIEYRIITNSKEIRHITSSTKILPDPERLGKVKVFGIAQDITNLRKAEIESKRLYHTMKATPDLVVIISPHNKLIFLNNAAADFYQQKANWQVLSEHNPILQEVFPKEIRDSALSQRVYYGENNLSRHDGKKIPVSQVTIAFNTENGELDSFSSVIRDMSQHKRIEQDLLFKKHELDTFIYHASHDLRGPIASLQGLNMLIEQDLKSDEGKKYLKMYETEVSRLHNILLSLVDLTRIKDKTLQTNQLNFDSMIQACIQAERYRPGFDEIKFIVDIVLEEPYKGDIELLTILFSSLIRNVIDFRDEQKESYVKIMVKKEHNSLTISFIDNGIGITEQIKHKIFNMFYRGSEKSQGQGLGLYMVRNVVERLKGELELESKEKQGTSLYIRIPFQSV